MKFLNAILDIYMNVVSISTYKLKYTDRLTVFIIYFLSIKSTDTSRVLRWRWNRMGRPLSTAQIHLKVIWTLSKFHKTTSERWQRTTGPQKGSTLSLKGGRTKYKRWETKELLMESHPGEGYVKVEKFPNTRKPSHCWVCGEFWNLRGQHN